MQFKLPGWGGYVSPCWALKTAYARAARKVFHSGQAKILWLCAKSRYAGLKQEVEIRTHKNKE